LFIALSSLAAFTSTPTSWLSHILIHDHEKACLDNSMDEPAEGEVAAMERNAIVDRDLRDIFDLFGWRSSS